MCVTVDIHHLRTHIAVQGRFRLKGSFSVRIVLIVVVYEVWCGLTNILSSLVSLCNNTIAGHAWETTRLQLNSGSMVYNSKIIILCQ